MNDKVPMSQIVSGVQQCGSLGMVSLVLSGALLVRMGYELGLNHAKKLLKQHDKDVRYMYKREKRIYREQKKKEKEYVDRDGQLRVKKVT